MGGGQGAMENGWPYKFHPIYAIAYKFQSVIRWVLFFSDSNSLGCVEFKSTELQEKATANL